MRSLVCILVRRLVRAGCRKPDRTRRGTGRVLSIEADACPPRSLGPRARWLSRAGGWGWGEARRGPAQGRVVALRCGASRCSPASGRRLRPARTLPGQQHPLLGICAVG